MDAQQQEQAAFDQSFADVTGAELTAATAASTEAPAVAEGAPAPDPVEPTAPDTGEVPEGEPAAAPAPEGQAPQEQGGAEEDPVVFDGFKRSELRQHIREVHARRTERLMAIAQDGFHDFHRFCHNKTLQCFHNPRLSLVAQKRTNAKR